MEYLEITITFAILEQVSGKSIVYYVVIKWMKSSQTLVFTYYEILVVDLYSTNK